MCQISWIVPAVKKVNSTMRERLNLSFRRRPILCTTLYTNPIQASNFGGTFDQLFLLRQQQRTKKDKRRFREQDKRTKISVSVSNKKVLWILSFQLTTFSLNFYMQFSHKIPLYFFYAWYKKVKMTKNSNQGVLFVIVVFLA